MGYKKPVTRRGPALLVWNYDQRIQSPEELAAAYAAAHAQRLAKRRRVTVAELPAELERMQLRQDSVALARKLAAAS